MELLKLALSCLRVGAFVFGGGPVLIPLLEDDVVHRYGWLTDEEFADAVALGQMTPGPLLVTATFVGYHLGNPTDGGGSWGLGLLYATVATVCIFLPSFFMTIIASHQLSRIKSNPWVQRALKGIGAGVVGLVAAAAINIGWQNLDMWPQFVILGLAAVALIRFKVDTGIVVVSAGMLGLLGMWGGLIGTP